jgi:hypothetical protein
VELLSVCYASPFVRRRAQNSPWKITAQPAVFTYHSSIDDGVVHSHRALDQPLGPGRVILRPLRFA